MIRALFFILSICAVSALQSADYYWIGGSGNWSDLSHWATTSGGGVNHSQIPSSEDDIFFDANSFTADGQTVTFNNDIVFARNLSFVGNDDNVNVIGGRTVIISSFGSFDLGTNVNFDYQGIISFNGGLTGNIINFNGNAAGRELYMSGEGDWRLTGPLEVDSILQFNSGTFSTGDQAIRTQLFNISTDAIKSLSWGASSIEVWGKFGLHPYNEQMDTVTATINTNNLTVDPGTSEFNFSAPRTEIRLTGNGIMTWYNVEFSNPRGRNYIRRFQDDAGNVWNDVTFRGSARIDGDHSMAGLFLSGNKVYRLEAGRLVRLESISATGTCSEGIIITSSQAGRSTMLNSTQDINLDFVTLRDINSSGANFTATNSTDLGNNQGWTFTNSASVDFYWIGGEGDWNDPNHWALSTGGPSSGCVPTGKDRAFFDADSFAGANDTVHVNLEDIFIKDMIWDGFSGSPVLAGIEENSIHITGSLALDQGIQHLFEGDYFFESLVMGNTISLDGIQLNRNVTFGGAAAGWTLLGDFYSHETLTHNSGLINAPGITIDIWQYMSRGDQSRSLDITDSHVILHAVDNIAGFEEFRPEWRVETNNFVLLASNSTIDIRTGYFGGFFNEGEDGLTFNKVIFNSYGGEIYNANYVQFEIPLVRIDSLIFTRRGSINGYQNIGYLKLTEGYDYRFGSFSTYNIEVLDANGTCGKGVIDIATFEPSRVAQFRIEEDHTLERLMIQDIEQIGSGTLTANNSLDNGNNTGWIFDEPASRTLYWVGDTGAWEDSTHWSLSSAGMGGECIPTAIDDVIFDANSFSLENQAVYSDATRFNSVRDMTWTNVFGRPTFGYYYDAAEDINFSIEEIKIFGSLSYDEDMNLNLFNHYFYTPEIDSVFANGNALNRIFMNGTGSIYFMDDNIGAFDYIQNNGTSYFNDINVQYNSFNVRCYNPASCEVNLQNSYITLGRSSSDQTNFTVLGDRVNFISDSSTIEAIGIRNDFVMNDSPVILNRVIATNPEGTTFFGDRYPEWNKPEVSSLMSIGFIQLAGNGIFLGEGRHGTLIGSPGKTYSLEGGETMFIRDYLQMIGNNCTPIQLLSTNTGELANINMFSVSEMLVDFVEMRDINAIGGADFIAGARSTDIAMSNRGWNFEDPPEFVETGFLGVDRTLCQTDAVELSAYNFSNGETYLWSDGTTDTTVTVNSTGTFNVTVTFGNGCEVSDEIIILEPQDIAVNLPGDTIICEGTVLQLNGDIGIQGVNYVWQDSFRRPSRDVTIAGEYILSAEIDGCFTRDSLIVTTQEAPQLELGGDQTLCENETTTLDATTPGADYRWQDNSTNAVFDVTTEGTYTVEVAINGCTLVDSVVVDYIILPVANIGNDTTLCQGDILVLSGPEGLDFYSWSTGQANRQTAARESGIYTLDYGSRQCVAMDSIEVDFQVPPALDLGGNQAACDGAQLNLSANVEGDAYLWDNGATTRDIDVSAAGTYTLALTSGACEVTDQVEVVLSTFPVIALGNDTTLCENAPLSLSFDRNSDFVYNWQDGTDTEVLDITTSGTYTLSADNQGCVTRDAVNVTFDPRPQLDLGTSQAICDGEQAQLIAGVTGDVFSWSNGESTPDISVSQPGTYTLSVMAGTCTVTDDVVVNVSTFPVIALGNDTLICEGENLILESIQNSTFQLQWQDGSTGNSFTVSEAGSYSLSADNNGCISTDEITINYQAAPQLNLGGNREVCEGDLVTLSTSVNADTYLWEDGQTTPTITVTESRDYSVSITQGVCFRDDTVNVNFNSFPIVDLGPVDASICDKDVLRLTTTQAGIWQDGSTSDVFEARTPGLYHVLLSNNGCETRDSINLEVRALPEVDLGADQTLCDGENTTISAPSALSEFSWEDGSDDQTRAITSSGTYWLEAIENNCPNRDSVDIQFNSLPTLSLGLDTTVCAEQGFLINAVASNGTITWPDGSSGEQFNVITPGIISASINNGCVTDASVNINFRECFYFNMYLPNAFSPNSGNNNNLFKPDISRGVQILSYDMQVYNRWGNLLFSTQSPDEGWNGYVNDVNTKTGVYVYRVNVSYQDDNGFGETAVSGDVLLVE